MMSAAGTQGASFRWDRLPVVSLALHHRLIACKPPAR